VSAGATGTLYVVATPIGNLEDVTLRALRLLGEVDVVLCEDTRTTRKLFARHGIETRLWSCHEHNEAKRAGEVAARLAAGQSVALVTDAGTPLVSDPGARVIAAAIAAGAAVVPVPGPSAALAALAVSGLAADRFTFFGFPPRKGRARGEFLAAVLAGDGVAVLFEAPHRVGPTLAELARLAPERRASLHRELTKVHEESLRGTLAELSAAVAARPPRGEYTLVVAGAGTAPAHPEEDLAAAVGEARERVDDGSSPRDAARAVAAERGVSRRAVYQALIGGEREGSGEDE
jgi:16S rRNA (cytidine1402-2'-O)-methyltransferase